MSDQTTKSVYRNFSPTTFAVDNGTSIIILAIMILFFGMSSYTNMPKELFPEVVVPMIYVSTPYPGNSAVDIEDLVSKPIEKEIKSITGLKKVTSNSIQGFSAVVAEFETDVEIKDALQKVKDAVDKAKSDLPNDLPQEPNATDINFAEFPIVSINLSGEFSVDELRNYAEYLEDKIETLNEVSKVEIKGALEREVKVDVDLPKMQSLKISFYDIESAIASENLTISGGEIVSNGFRRDIRVVGQFRTVKEIGDIIIKSDNQRPIYLRDLANVKLSFTDPTSYARSDQLPVVSVDVIKRAGANLLDASDQIKAILGEAKASGKFPEDLNIYLFNDASIMVRKQVAELENSIISGVILVVLVLLFFLGIRNAMFVGLAIPLSMLMGILMLNIFGIPLNLMVLFSLILALGLLVDNAIVVVENIYRYMQEGHSGWEAAKKGAGEVAVAIIASTATTLAAFVPLLFWPGIMGKFMSNLPITLIAVLASSLFVALVINPVFTSLLMKIDEKADEKTVRKRKMINVLLWIVGLSLLAGLMHLAGDKMWRGLLGFAAGLTLLNYFVLRPAAFFFQNVILPILETGYDKFIRLVLYKFMPSLTFIGTFLLLFASIVLLGIYTPKLVYFPKSLPNYVNVFVEMPFGTDIEATNEVVKEIEKNVAKTVEPYRVAIDAILTQIGQGTSDPMMSFGDGGNTPHKARVTVSFKTFENRQGINTFEVLTKIRENLVGFPGVKITVDQDASGPPAGKPINLELTGEEIEKLVPLSQDVIAYLNAANIPGIEELQADVKLGKPQLLIKVDREAARRYGVSTQDIGFNLRSAIYGREVTKLKVRDEEYPIQIRLDEKYRYKIDALMNQVITFRSPNGKISQVPISAVATIDYSTTYTTVNRKDSDRMITVFSNVLDGYNPTEIVAALTERMETYNMPEGYEYEFTGEQEDQAEATAFLSQAFTIALFAIFIILVSQFNSVISPFIIVLSVLFSTIGVFLGYLFTGMDFVLIMTGVGIISLAGIVVNNAIVLVDYIELLKQRKRQALGLDRRERLPKQAVKAAIIEAGKTRLRPVLLTAITTVLGLIPLAVGFNMNFASLITDLDPQIFIGGDNVVFWGPMSWTVIYGLVFATFLTLIVVPVMYWLADRLNVGFNRLFFRSRKQVTTT